MLTLIIREIEVNETEYFLIKLLNYKLIGCNKNWLDFTFCFRFGWPDDSVGHRDERTF